MTAPIMDWESQNEVDDAGRVIWWNRLDGRYQIEVHRLEGQPYRAMLRMWDRAKGGELVLEQQVGVAYDAVFGPDVADTVQWRRIALRFADSVVP